jgi:hypothetical protein
MFGLESILIQGAFKVALAVTAILAARITVLWMDKHLARGESNFAHWLNNADDLTKGIYYGARWVGVAIIVAGAVG